MNSDSAAIEADVAFGFEETAEFPLFQAPATQVLPGRSGRGRRSDATDSSYATCGRRAILRRLSYLSAISSADIQPYAANDGQPNRGRGPDAGSFYSAFPKDRQFPRRFGIFDMAAPSDGQSGADAFPPAELKNEKTTEDGEMPEQTVQRHCQPKQNAGRRPHRLKKGDRRAAKRYETYYAARRRGLRARRGRSESGHLRRDVEVAASQGTTEAARPAGKAKRLTLFF